MSNTFNQADLDGIDFNSLTIKETIVLLLKIGLLVPSSIVAATSFMANKSQRYEFFRLLREDPIKAVALFDGESAKYVKTKMRDTFSIDHADKTITLTTNELKGLEAWARRKSEDDPSAFDGYYGKGKIAILAKKYAESAQ